MTAATSTAPSPRRSHRTQVIAVLVMLATLAVGAWGLSAWLQGYRARMQYVGHPIYSFALPDLHAPERTVRAEDLRGEPYLLEAFASWCPACTAGHEDTTRLARQYRLRLIGYNLEDDRDDALAWLARKGDPFARIVADRDGETGLYGLKFYATPYFVLVDADGIIRWRHGGTLDEAAVTEGLEPALRAMGHLP